MIRKMRAIEYNTLMTLLKLLLDRVPIIANDYGMGGINIPILPEYPSDLTDLEKPSIIMRKVDTRQSKVGLGNVLGQHYDNELGGYVDVVGKIHDIMVQFDIVSSNNTNVSILQSLIADDILNKISFEENGKITLYDFIDNINNPTEMGYIKLIGDPHVVTVSDDDKSTTLDHFGVVRHNFSILQAVVPKQEYVDLSKWIRQTYTIKI